MPLSQLLRNQSWRAALLALVVGSGLGAAPDDADRHTPTVKAIAKALPSVVSVASEKRASSNKRWPFDNTEDRQPRIAGMGTGVVIDHRGYILTNQHVVDQVADVEVTLHNGHPYKAKIVAEDKKNDLAILKIEPRETVQPMAIGTSADLMLGEPVITIGNAFGYEETASQGIISALDRSVALSDHQTYRHLIQTDACINPGNSGGAMVNIHGELVGINVAVRAGAQGIGFALPIDEVLNTAKDMMSTRRLKATQHGLAAVFRLLENDRQVVLNEVKTGSPAEKNGFKVGDRVVRVGDIQVSNPLDIERGMLDVAPGASVQVVVLRDGKEERLPLSVTQVGADASAEIWQILGIKVQPVDETYVKKALPGYPQLHGGLWISEVAPGGVAARSNFARGDILLGLNPGPNNFETTQIDHLTYILGVHRQSKAAPLKFYLGRNKTFYADAFKFNSAPAPALAPAAAIAPVNNNPTPIAAVGVRPAGR